MLYVYVLGGGGGGLGKLCFIIESPICRIYGNQKGQNTFDNP